MDIEKNIIIEECVSHAWAKAFKATYFNKDVTPFSVSISGLDNSSYKEDTIIRSSLDKFLCQKKHASIDTVSNTIFPSSLWNPNKDRSLFFQRYLKCYPTIKKSEPINRNGTYFGRLISYDNDSENGNQIDDILKQWESKNHRNSGLQAGLYNPMKDRNKSRIGLGFPCMQQICFSPIGTNGKDGLSVSAFYATQTIVEKAYGNYLGIIQLGQFMASQMDLELKSVTLFVSKAKFKNDTKGKKSDYTEIWNILKDL